MAGVIERLKARVKDELPAHFHPPVSMEVIAVAERALGFPLPDLLRAIYTEVGNGGFGPGYGFIGLEADASDHSGNTLVDCYKEMLSWAEENPHWNWPRGLLPICCLGCDMFSCVDCELGMIPVLLFDPNDIDATETNPDEAVLRWTNAFWAEAVSLAGWLTRWLDGRPGPEPKWPSKSWLSKRLWPGKPANVRLFLDA